MVEVAQHRRGFSKLGKEKSLLWFFLAVLSSEMQLYLYPSTPREDDDCNALVLIKRNVA